MSCAETVRMVTDQGFSCSQIYEEPNEEDQQLVLFEVMHLYVNTVDDIEQLRITRGEENEAEFELPPCLPDDLIESTPQKFFEFVASQKDRLLAYYDAQKVVQIDIEFTRFRIQRPRID